MGFKHKRIIIVDDSQTFLMYMSMLLNRMGFKVIPAESGIELLKILNLMEPDIVILDVTMPVMDGIKALKHLKNDNQWSNIPVIMVSLDSSEETIEKCKSFGCSDYLTKPINIGKLNEALQGSIFSPTGWKRKHLRAPFVKKVSVTYSGVSRELYAETLSEGGIYIRSKEPFPVGTEMEITLPLKDKKNITLKGNVIYTKGLFGAVFKVPPGVAVQFKDLTNEETNILVDYIKGLLAEDIIDGQEEPVITMDDIE